MAGESYKTNLQVQNSVAQRDILKQELVEVTAALTETNKLNSDAKSEYEDLKTASAELLLQNKKDTDEAKNLLEQASEALTRAKLMEQSAIDRATESDTKIAEKEAASLELLQDQSRKIVDNDTILAEQDKNITSRSNILESIDSSIEDTKLTLEGLYGKIRESDASYAAEKDLRDRSLGDIQKEISLAQDTLASVLEQIDQEKIKISAPMAALRQEEAEMRGKRADIGIYENRIREQYEKLFPDRAMKI